MKWENNVESREMRHFQATMSLVSMNSALGGWPDLDRRRDAELIDVDCG